MASRLARNQQLALQLHHDLGGSTMKHVLHMDGSVAAGGSALVCHNERLADPLDEYARAIGAIKRRGKTEADHLETARLEFLGGLYTTPELGPVLPAWNVLRCLQGGAKRHKRGADVLRGIYPQVENAAIQYDGPRDPAELWQAGGFALRKSVGIQRNRIMRTRPIFTEWKVALLVEVDPTVFDCHTLATLWREAGIYEGIGEMRPVYGRFTATLECLHDDKGEK
jgi:hypothetical protein